MLIEKPYFEEILFKFNSLTIYKKVNSDETIKKFCMICKSILENIDNKTICLMYNDFVSSVVCNAEIFGFSHSIFKKYLLHLFLSDENIFSLACENQTISDSKSILNLAIQDIYILNFLLSIDIKNLSIHFGHNEDLENYSPVFIQKNKVFEDIYNYSSVEKLVELISKYYKNYGSGIFSNNALFYYNEFENKFDLLKYKSIYNLDDIQDNRLQKETLINNTLSFLNKNHSNNLLLYGEDDFEKSSYVMALGNKYYEDGLRIIQIKKHQINYLDIIISNLSKRGKYFILFIENIKLEDIFAYDEKLKNILNTKINLKPENILIYATFDPKINLIDNLNSKYYNFYDISVYSQSSLSCISQYFGLIIPFLDLTSKNYIQNILELAKSQKFNALEDYLISQTLNQKIFK